ncbi:DUF2274 domain-containing protein [Defluviicoccus vanus]|uniref:DUF2274 domain-containing protein n=1 Tax=Defluviicoccus vanus TaxID=111831 RepID=UPI001CBA6093
MDTALAADLESYREAYAEAHGQRIGLDQLVPAILRAFLHRDRGFQKWKKNTARVAVPLPSTLSPTAIPNLYLGLRSPWSTGAALFRLTATKKVDYQPTARCKLNDSTKATVCRAPGPQRFRDGRLSRSIGKLAHRPCSSAAQVGISSAYSSCRRL